MEKFSPVKPEKEAISLRISTVTLRQIDSRAAAFDISRNEFINQCIAFALSNMNESTESERSPGAE